MKTIDEQVFDGIRKTINRFREKPFHYFTEADIHSSLLNDILNLKLFSTSPLSPPSSPSSSSHNASKEGK